MSIEAMTSLVIGTVAEPFVSELALITAGLAGLALTTVAIVRELGASRS